MCIYGQDEKLIIWNDKLVNKAYINISDSSSLNDFLYKHIISYDDTYFLVYYGNNISNLQNYKFIYKPIVVLLNVDKNGDNPHSYLKSFIMNDTTFLKNDCYPIKDSLPDGLWMQVMKKNDSIYILSQKSIINYKLHNLYKDSYSNGMVFEIAKYINGFSVDTTFYYNKNGTLNYIYIWRDSCNKISESIFYDSGNIVRYCNNRLKKNDTDSCLEFKSTKEIKKIIKFDKGVRFYKKDDELFMVKYYKR